MGLSFWQSFMMIHSSKIVDFSLSLIINFRTVRFFLSVSTSDVSRTFPDREFPGKFPKSRSREIFSYSREFREIGV